MKRAYAPKIVQFENFLELFFFKFQPLLTREALKAL